MSQHQRILELVKAGNISVEQGVELLNALERRNAAPPKPPLETPPDAPTAPKPPRVGRPLSSAGGKLSFDQIVQLGMYHIKPDYVEEMRKAGLHDLSFNDIVQLGMYHIKPDYVSEMRAIAEDLGFAPLTTSHVIQLGMYHIKPDYVRQMIASGILDMESLLKTGNEYSAQRRAKLEAKLAKLEAKLGRANTEREREKLEEMRDELQGELDELAEQEATELEIRLEAELEADDDPMRDFDPHEPSHTSRQWFDINGFLEPDLPLGVRVAALEEALQSINADLGITQDKAERAALKDIQRQINQEIAKAKADMARDTSTP